MNVTRCVFTCKPTVHASCGPRSQDARLSMCNRTLLPCRMGRLPSWPCSPDAACRSSPAVSTPMQRGDPLARGVIKVGAHALCMQDLALTTTRSISMRVAAHQSMAFSPAVQELLAHMDELPNVKAGSLAAGGTVSSLEASMSFTTNAYVALVCGGIGRPVGGVWRRKKKDAVGAGAEDGGTPASGGGRPVGEASIPSSSYGWMPLTFDPCRPLSPPQTLKAATNAACGVDSGSAADARSSASGMSASVVLGAAAAPVRARVAGSAVHAKPGSRKASAQEEMVAALPNAMP